MKILGAAIFLALAAAAGQDDLKAKFEAKRATDPVGAFKLLAESPGGPAGEIARAALARQLSQDLAAGLKAWSENNAALAETHLLRAAQLASPYSPEFSRELSRAILLLNQPLKAPLACATCKGAGRAPCAACKQGLALQPCPRCEAKGSVNCLLCAGSGALDHHGYKGTLVLSVKTDTRVTFKDPSGKVLKGTLPAQVLTYGMAPCSGGSFTLTTESVVAKTQAKKTDTTSQPCEKFWDQMKMFVFSGKAKIQVNNNKGQLAPLTPTAAKRFFADYEACKAGSLTCDRCVGKKTDACSTCEGKGQANLPCAACDGTSIAACAACKGYGDGTFMVRVLPAAPVLAKTLDEQGRTLHEWLNGRSRRASRQGDLTRLLAEAKKGADATAKFDADKGFVDVLCPKCKGAGSACEDCWGAGRREFLEGSAPYERYALIDRLGRQLADAAKAVPAPPPAFSPLPENETGAAPVAVLPPSAPSATPPPAPLPGSALIIPATVEEMLKKADALHETGKSHLEKSKASSDNAVWIQEAQLAVKDLRDAQALYGSAQEKLDETGAPVPRTLLDKFRINMQALVMARKQVP